MTMLSRDQLRERIAWETPLVENMIDKDTQLQPNSVELTLRTVESLKGLGAVDFDNSQRQVPQSENLEFDSGGWILLAPGTYKVTFNEIVNIPLDLAAIARPRSSLLRCGVTVESAVWDSGYRGRSESMLVVYNPYGFRVRKNARLLQLVFYSLQSKVEQGYNGRYQHENI
ncbi:deoxyuridine 5'-triphosphate nucleotidohydrolase [Methanolobus chelungpuianus]|uniref:Probable deoxyuridine 5'-triphosphate nucleotidohydrolase n=1 Tax=Methanolobus chelungpuianus TaxID=502115 RepID=A0AAE3KY69_9EURY|nr:deoxyuridine 5'-triphosphate nucleotidohydrolase [Methanolobus chelungpuianus]MCQ6961808.1 deoxyuridine 5'-triphosphate nucleotidohydrolase [Methanolobus chelungpuianus]